MTTTHRFPRLILRLLLWTTAGAAALVFFVAAGGWSSLPVRWTDLSGWLDEVSSEDAFIEVVRWLGIAVGAYITVVAGTGLLAELAAKVRLAPVARVLRRVSMRSAAPVLRDRLWRTATSVAVAGSVMTVSSGGMVGAAAPAAPVELVVDVQAGGGVLDGVDFVGFSTEASAVSVIDASVPVVVAAPGDTLASLSQAHYGYVDDTVLAHVSTVNAIANPDRLAVGQIIAMAPMIGEIAQGAATWGSYQVVRDDTLWGILEAHYGDVDADLIWHIAAANGLDNPDELAVGQMLTLPSLDNDIAVDAANAVVEVDDVVVVQVGDSLSVIAASRLGDADRWVEIWEANRGRTMDDGRLFDDSNVLHPGWTLQLATTTLLPLVEEIPNPAVDDALAPTIDSTPPNTIELPTASPAPQVQPRVDVDVGVDGDGVEVAPGDGAVLAPPVATTGVAGAVPASASTTTPPSTMVVSDIDDKIDDTTLGWYRSVWPQIAAGSLLLAGLGLMVRRLRLRRLGRLEPGQRLALPPQVAAGTELAILRSPNAMVELSTLRGLMQSLTPYAAEQADPAPVRAVQIGTDRIEILFAAPAPMPPKGWSTIDGGQSWTHRLDEDTISSKQLLTPALVTIGIRCDESGDEVLLDLETAASVAIAGDHTAAIGLARSMALELATYPMGVPMDVFPIGLNIDGTEVCDRVWLDTTMTRAVRVARQRLNQIAAEGASSMIAARAELDEDNGDHDPQVFIVDTTALTVDDLALVDELVELCQASTGTAVVLVGDHGGVNERIVIDSHSNGVWSQCALVCPNVTREAAAEAAVMLDHAANAESEPMEPSPMMAELLVDANDTFDIEHTEAFEAGDWFAAADHADSHGATTHDGVDEVVEYVYEPPAFDVMVQVMGMVRAHGRELTADETELVTLLACLRSQNQAHIGVIHEAIAPDVQHKTVKNRISNLRKRLGVGSDGADLLPNAQTGRNARSEYIVSNLVLTDVDLLEHRLHTAHTLGSTDALRVLRDGLDLMNGPLFRARKGFDGWPHSEGITVAMTATIQSYATRLIELAVEVDDIALVVRTTAAAGRVLDNPVAEFPFRQVEQAYAEACGDDDLAASVAAARRKLLDYMNNQDSLATG